MSEFKKRFQIKRILAAFLAVIMVVTMVPPSAVYAAEPELESTTDSEDTQEIDTAVDTDTDDVFSPEEVGDDVSSDDVLDDVDTVTPEVSDSAENNTEPKESDSEEPSSTDADPTEEEDGSDETPNLESESGVIALEDPSSEEGTDTNKTITIYGSGNYEAVAEISPVFGGFDLKTTVSAKDGGSDNSTTTVRLYLYIRKSGATEWPTYKQDNSVTLGEEVTWQVNELEIGEVYEIALSTNSSNSSLSGEDEPSILSVTTSDYGDGSWSDAIETAYNGYGYMAASFGSIPDEISLDKYGYYNSPYIYVFNNSYAQQISSYYSEGEWYSYSIEYYLKEGSEADIFVKATYNDKSGYKKIGKLKRKDLSNIGIELNSNVTYNDDMLRMNVPVKFTGLEEGEDLTGLYLRSSDYKYFPISGLESTYMESLKNLIIQGDLSVYIVEDQYCGKAETPSYQRIKNFTISDVKYPSNPNIKLTTSNITPGLDNVYIDVEAQDVVSGTLGKYKFISAYVYVKEYQENADNNNWSSSRLSGSTTLDESNEYKGSVCIANLEPNKQYSYCVFLQAEKEIDGQYADAYINRFTSNDCSFATISTEDLSAEVSASPLISNATISASFNVPLPDSSTRPILYYRQSGTDTDSWTMVNSWYGNIDSTTHRTITWTLSSLEANTEYEYYVSYKDMQFPDPAAAFTTKSIDTAAEHIQSVEISPYTDSAYVSIYAAEDIDTSVRYRFEYKPHASGSWNTNNSFKFSYDNDSWDRTISSLSEDTEYDWQITASTQSGSEWVVIKEGSFKTEIGYRSDHTADIELIKTGITSVTFDVTVNHIQSDEALRIVPVVTSSNGSTNTGSSRWFYTNNNKATITITGLNPDTNYTSEFRLLNNYGERINIFYGDSFTTKSTASITLRELRTTETYVQGADLSAVFNVDLQGTYGYFFYRKVGAETWQQRFIYSSYNSVTQQYDSFTATLSGLEENTTYEYKFSIFDREFSDGEVFGIDTDKYLTFTTKAKDTLKDIKADVTVTPDFQSAEFSVNYSAVDKTVYVEFYTKVQGASEESWNYKSGNYMPANTNSNPVIYTIRNLLPDTTYDYKLVISSEEEIVLATGNFSTKELTATIEEPVTYAAGAEIKAIFNADPKSYEGPTLRYRRQGTAEETFNWESGNTEVSVDGTSVDFIITDLMPDTTYEYKISFMDVEFSDGKLTGEDTDKYKTFKTKSAEDLKNLTASITADAGLDRSKIKAVFDSIDKTVRVSLLYRLKTSGEDEALWNRRSMGLMANLPIDPATGKQYFEATINNLLPGHTYEYKLQLTAGGIDPVDIKDSQKEFKLGLPSMEVSAEAQSYDAEIAAVSKDIEELSSSHSLALIYTANDDATLDLSQASIAAETVAANTTWNIQDVNLYEFELDTFTKTSTAAIAFAGLNAGKTYKYGIYLISGDAYFKLASDTFTTQAARTKDSYKINVVKTDIGYAAAKVTLSSETEGLIAGSYKDDTIDETSYKRGYILTYVDADGNTQRLNQEVYETPDSKTGRFEITISKREGCKDYKLIPYITAPTGEKGEGERITASEQAITFKDISEIKASDVTTGVKLLGGAKLLISGKLDPVYAVDGRSISVEISYQQKDAATPTTTRAYPKEDGTFTVSIPVDYDATYTITLTAATSAGDKNDKILAAPLENVTTGTNFINAEVKGATPESALAIVRAKENPNNFLKLVYVKADNADAAVLSKGGEGFSEAFAKQTIQSLYYTSSIDSTSESYLCTADISGLTPGTTYSYAFAVERDGTYVYKQGSEFTTPASVSAQNLGVVLLADRGYNTVTATGQIVNPDDAKIDSVGFAYKYDKSDEWTEISEDYNYNHITGRFTWDVTDYLTADHSSILVRAYVKPAVPDGAKEEDYKVVYSSTEGEELSKLKLSEAGITIEGSESEEDRMADSFTINAVVKKGEADLKDLRDLLLQVQYKEKGSTDWKNGSSSEYILKDELDKSGTIETSLTIDDRDLAPKKQYDVRLVLIQGTGNIADETTYVAKTQEFAAETDSVKMDINASVYMTKANIDVNLANIKLKNVERLLPDAYIEFSYKKASDSAYSKLPDTYELLNGSAKIELTDLDQDTEYKVQATLYATADAAPEVQATTEEVSFTTEGVGTYMEFYNAKTSSISLYGVIAPVYGDNFWEGRVEGPVDVDRIDIRYRKSGEQEWKTEEKRVYNYIVDEAPVLFGLESGTSYEAEIDIKTGEKVLDTLKGLSFETLEATPSVPSDLKEAELILNEAELRTDRLAIGLTASAEGNYFRRNVKITLYNASGEEVGSDWTIYRGNTSKDENGRFITVYDDVYFYGLTAGTAYTAKASYETGETSVQIAEKAFSTLENALVTNPIEDPNLLKIIQQKYLGGSEELRVADIERVTEIEITKETLKDYHVTAIKNIKGLEVFKYLERLTINNQEIEDASALSGLTELEMVDLRYNYINVVPDLRSSQNLQELYLNYNAESLRAEASGIRRNRKVAHIEVIDLASGNYRSIHKTELNSSANVYETIEGIDPLVNLAVDGFRLDWEYTVKMTIDDTVVYDGPKGNFGNNVNFHEQLKLAQGTHTVKFEITPAAYTGETLTLPDAEAVVTIVKFTDPNFESAVKAACLAENCALQELTVLTLIKGSEDAAITSIDGVQYLTGLRELTVSGHDLTEVDVLKTRLYNLRKLDLSYNKLTTIPDLEQQSDLETLDLRWNSIPKEEFHSNNPKLPSQFRNNKAWLEKQGSCQFTEGDKLRLNVSEGTVFAAVKDSLNIAIESRGLPYEYYSSYGTYTMVIKDGSTEAGRAVVGYPSYDENDYQYHKFNFIGLNLADGSHDLTFEVWEGSRLIGSTEIKSISVKRNVIEDECLREYLDSERPITDIKTINKNSSLSDNQVIKSLNGIGYLTGLTSIYLAGQELDTVPAEELAKLMDLKVLNLSYNNLTEKPAVPASVKTLKIEGNLIQGEKKQRTLGLTAADTYYINNNQTQIYMEADGLKRSYRNYRITLTGTDGKTVAVLSEKYNSYGNLIGFESKSIKLPADTSYTVTASVTDNLGTVVYKQENVTFQVVEQGIAATMTSNTLASPGRVTVKMTAPVGSKNETLESLTISGNGWEQTFDSRQDIDLRNSSVSAYPSDQFAYGYNLSLGATTVTANLILTQMLAKGSYTITAVTSERTLLAENVKFDEDGIGTISRVTAASGYENTGKYFYLQIEGNGLVTDKIEPALKSRDGADLTKDPKIVSRRQASVNGTETVVYRLTKDNLQIWNNRSSDSLLSTNGRQEGIKYALTLKDGYQLDRLSALTGYVAYTQSANGDRDIQYKALSNVFNYANGHLETTFDENASNLTVTAYIYDYPAKSASAIIKNGKAEFDFSNRNISSGIHTVTYSVASNTSSLDLNMPVPWEAWERSVSNQTGRIIITDENGTELENASLVEGSTDVYFKVDITVEEEITEDDIYRAALSGTEKEVSKKLIMPAATIVDGKYSYSLTDKLTTTSPMVNGIYYIALEKYNNEDEDWDLVASDRVYIYNSSAKVFASRMRSEDPYLYISTTKSKILEQEASASGATKFTLKLTPYGSETQSETKAVDRKDIRFDYGQIRIDLSSYIDADLTDFWVDVEYDGQDIYDVEDPEMTYFASYKGDDIHEEYGLYCSVSRTLQVLWNEKGFIKGFYSSYGIKEAVISDPALSAKDISLQNAVEQKEYTFTSKDLKGLDLTKVYTLTLEDTMGNIKEFQGNLTTGQAPAGLKISREKAILNGYYEQSMQLAVTTTTKVGDANVIWSTSDAEVASITPSGRVTANGVGTATMTATSVHDDSISVSCDVEVHEFYIETQDGTDMVVGETSRLAAWLDGEEITNVTYTSYAPNVVSVTGDTLTANIKGTARILASPEGIEGLIDYVDITAESKLKGILLTGLEQQLDNDAPAIKTADGYQVKQYSQYDVEHKTTPSNTELTDEMLVYTSSDPSVVSVSRSNGRMTAVKDGTATITVTAKEGDAEYADSVQVTVLKDPTSRPENKLDGLTSIYVANSGKKLTLGAIKLPEGWKWTENTKTELTKDLPYDVSITYDAAGYYPVTKQILINTGTALPLDVTEVNRRNVITKLSDDSKKDGSLELIVGEACTGTMLYTVKMEADDPNLKVTKLDNSRFKLSAEDGCKTGKHTITVTREYRNVYTYDDSRTPVEWTKSYIQTKKLTYEVVEGNVVDKILVNDASVPFDMALNNGTRTLEVTAYDQWGDQIENPALVWSSSDTKVVKVKAQADTTKADLTSKEEGYAIVRIASKANKAIYTEAKIQVKDLTPRIDTNKATLNAAVDYTTDAGLRYAEYVRILPAYGSQWDDTVPTIVSSDSQHIVSSRLKIAEIEDSDGYYWILPQDGVDLSTSDSGKYAIRVKVKYTDEPYYLPFTVKVVNKTPSVTLKQTDVVNLFYRNDTGTLSVTIKGEPYNKEYAPTLEWSNTPEEGEAGFEISESVLDVVSSYRYEISQNRYVELNAKNKLADTSMLKGTVKLTFPGYKDPIEKSFTIKTSYKAPVYTVYGHSQVINKTYKNKINICSDLRQTDYYAYIWSTEKDTDWTSKWVSKTTGSNKHGYQYATYNNKDLIFNADSGSEVTIHYTGKKSATVPIVFHNDVEWRGTTTAKVKMTVIKPTVSLSRNTLTLNKGYTGETNAYYRHVSTELIVKGYHPYGANLAFVKAEGDNKSQPLLSDETITISYGDDELEVGWNRAQDIRTGSYKFTVTPYRKAEDGGLTALKPLKLTVKVVDKAPTATVKLSGKLDLVKANDDPWESKIIVTPKIANVDANDLPKKAELNGVYKDLFDITTDLSGKSTITIADGYDHDSDRDGITGMHSMLRAKQSYQLSITYTLRSGIKVTTKPFTIKPIQSTPKVKTSLSGTQFYASAVPYGQVVSFEVPLGYEIAGIKLKDVPGISYSSINNERDEETGYIRISNSYLAKAAKNGKNTKLTFDVRLVGRDGVSKNATANVTIKVKR